MIWCGGTFDLFHPGHVDFFRKANVHGPVLAAVNTDEFASRYKRPPIMSLEERLAMVMSCRYVDLGIVNRHDEKTGDAIDDLHFEYPTLRVTHIAHGDDWMGEDLLRQLGIDQWWLDERRIQMLYLPYYKGISSSDIIGRLQCASR